MPNPNPKHKFKTGNSGKPKGAVNKVTKTVKETVLAAFNDLQQDPKANLLEWGKKNPAAFYQVAAKLIPTELNAKYEIAKPIVIDWSGEIKENDTDVA